MTLHEKIAQARLLAERASPAPWDNAPATEEWKANRENNGEFCRQARALLPALAEALAIAVKTMKEERANLERIQREIDQCKKHYKMHFYPTIGTFRLAEIDQALAEIRKALEVSE